MIHMKFMNDFFYILERTATWVWNPIFMALKGLRLSWTNGKEPFFLHLTILFMVGDFSGFEFRKLFFYILERTSKIDRPNAI